MSRLFLVYLRGLHFQQWTAESSIASRLPLGGSLVQLGDLSRRLFCVFLVLSNVVLEGLVGSGAGDHCLHSDLAFSVSGAPPRSPPQATESPLRLSAEDAHFHLRSSLACSSKEHLMSAGHILCLLCSVFLLQVSPDHFIHPRWSILEVCLSLLGLLEPGIRCPPPCLFPARVLFPSVPTQSPSHL